MHGVQSEAGGRSRAQNALEDLRAAIHDSGNPHNATFWWQTRSNPSGGGLLSIVPPN